jgi:Secretion system C-terminal sorting domain
MPTGKAGLFSVSTTWAGLSFLPLASENFENLNFNIISNNLKNGVLNIISPLNYDNALVSIYDIQGRKIESKTIEINKTSNEVNVNPIQNAGIYIIEILANNQKYIQKVIVN